MNPDMMFYKDLNYKDFSRDIKKLTYYFQCKHAGKHRSKKWE